MDAAEPPRVVIERPMPCSDADGADDLLRRALAPALAPAAGWVVRMRIDRVGTRALRARGEITDASGAPVAHRSVSGTSADCGGLARAVGIWASLVLDQELERANEVATELQPDGNAGATGSDPAAASAAAGPAGSWPAPAERDKPSPEHDWYLHHEDERTLELGAGVFLMTGTGGGALAGPTAFVVVEAGHGLFLRPALAFGQSLTSLPPSDVKSSTWAAGRFDTCLRLPGLYTKNHGMQLDACAGTDIGFTYVDAGSGTTLPYVDLGPSFNLRGELGSRLSAVLRVVAGINIVRQSFVDLSGAREEPPLAGGRLELAFSWDVR